MKVLMLNQSWFRLDKIAFGTFKYPHSSMSRNIQLAHHLALLKDVEVWFQTADSGSPSHPFAFKWWNGKEKDFDAVVTIQGLPLINNPEWKTHDMLVMFGDVEPDPAIKVFFVDSPVLQPIFKKSFPAIRVEQGAWGVTDWPSVPDPYPNHDKPIVFYAGHIYVKETFDFLNRLARNPDFETWAVFTVDKSVIGASGVRGLTDQERKALVSPELHLVSDIIGQEFGHGPVAYGKFSGFEQHADVGVCPGPGRTEPEKKVTFCKTYDYLGNGLPVIIDSRVPDVVNLTLVNGGTPFDYFRPESVVDAIKARIADKTDRIRMKKTALSLWGWEAIAENFLRVMTEELERRRK